MENAWAKALEEAKEVNVRINPRYSGDGQRPACFDVEYDVDGVPFERRFFNARGGTEPP